MKLTFFFLLCLTGLVPVARSTLRTVHHKYHLIMKLYSWPIAQNYCRMMYDDLATVITDDDWIRLNIEATSKGFTGYAWIGLDFGPDSWHWSLNNFPLESVPYTNWCPGEPNNYAGKEACVIINGGGVWEDYPCTGLKPFICYNANFTDSNRFISVSTPLSWSEAQIYCRTHHTDLASSLNSSDNDLLMQLGINSWIGLYRDTWKWSDGTNATNLQWGFGEPNNFFGNENCASNAMNAFYDYYCSYEAYFYCHTILPVREQQIMKLQFKSNGSVFDPAMQSSILEQIKKKLEENGMLENTTVTWRVQPNKEVFYKKNKDDL